MNLSTDSINDPPTDRLETFVPLHTTDLVEFLAQHPSLQGSEASQFRQVSTFILALLHHLYRQRHEQLTYLYAPLDPDRDTLLLSVPTRDERNRRCDQFFQRMRDALSRANYRQLTREEIEHAMNAASHWGVRMRVDFDALEHVEVYARGKSVGQKSYRHWRKLFRLTNTDVPLFQRLVVIFRMQQDYRSRENRFDSNRVYLRMFKNIPQQDVDMVMPATRLQMTWWDHSRIVLPSLYAVFATLGRLLRYLVLLTLLGIFKTLAFVILLVFAILFGIKSMLTYTVNTRRRYYLNVAQNLYYQSLDNNGGALLRLLEEGEQQEACETVLAYFVSAVMLRDEKDLSLSSIAAICETLVLEATGSQIQFDVRDAVQDLVNLGLMRASGDQWTAITLGEAIEKLDETWDKWFNG